MKGRIIKKNTTSFLVCFAIISFFFSCDQETQSEDLIITNANIWTGNNNQPKAQSMAILSDTILAIGSNEEILKFKNETTEMVDIAGRFVTSGFIDSHVHLDFKIFIVPKNKYDKINRNSIRC